MSTGCSVSPCFESLDDAVCPCWSLLCCCLQYPTLLPLPPFLVVLFLSATHNAKKAYDQPMPLIVGCIIYITCALLVRAVPSVLSGAAWCDTWCVCPRQQLGVRLRKAIKIFLSGYGRGCVCSQAQYAFCIYAVFERSSDFLDALAAGTDSVYWTDAVQSLFTAPELYVVVTSRL